MNEEEVKGKYYNSVGITARIYTKPKSVVSKSSKKWCRAKVRIQGNEFSPKSGKSERQSAIDLSIVASNSNADVLEAMEAGDLLYAQGFLTTQDWEDNKGRKRVQIRLMTKTVMKLDTNNVEQEI